MKKVLHYKQGALALEKMKACVFQKHKDTDPTYIVGAAP